MWSDNDTVVDLLDYQYLVSATTNIIHNPSLLPCTLGIYGDWGSGKSSLMRMVEELLSEDEKTLTIKFNGWLFEGYEDAKSVLMGTILEEIAEKKTVKGEAKKLLTKMLKQIDFMKIAKSVAKHGISFATAGPAGLAITGMDDLINLAKQVNPDDYIKEKKEPKEDKQKSLRMSIRKFHQDFACLLKKLEVDKLVIFIDDLDRCNTDTVIDTLEAIKLFLYVPNSAFVICADEKIIEYAVRRRFPEVPGRGLEVASAYLEKLIQFPIRLPRLNESELETYINLLFVKLYSKSEEDFLAVREEVINTSSNNSLGRKFDYQQAQEIMGDIPDELQKALLITQQIKSVLTVGLDGNPRQSKRFMNMLMMRIGMAKSKNITLEMRILAKLMLLEYFKKETFIRLHQFQAEQSGKPKEIQMLEKKLVADGQKEKNENDVSKTNAEIDIWIKDDWIQSWIKAKPYLSGVDLSSYFYFSRDRLNSGTNIKQQMSSQALDIFHKLTSGSEAFEKAALQEASTLSPSDASSIFEELKTKLLQESDSDGSINNFKLIFSWTKERGELLSQLLTFLKPLPVKIIPSSIVTMLLSIVKNTDYQQDGAVIIKAWAENEENSDLAKIAKSRIKQSK
ncbi:KAP family P-loop domain protein [Fulvivirga kasyanovii]|uniref:KAP family P-loop NTPase fold protein n=1 Tax=Fulvivirga kasyanovii TaxID=396812 RepID=UPI002C7343CA|nr:P-loop NTPase fold protein [Fulvivirga sp.]